ncbi:MAG: helix-turn-helix domain-containing protein, partial [Acidobacteriota bacterium]
MNAEHFLRELGRNVRARRVQRGLSQERLARLAGLSSRYVSQL